LDGCFYRKDGTISGGQADLIVKAKRWDKQHIFTLEERKVVNFLQDQCNKLHIVIYICTIF